MPIRTRDEMRRAIQSSVPRPAPQPQLSEQQIYMNRMRARMGGAAAAPAAVAIGGERQGPYVPDGLSTRTLGSSQPPIQQTVAYSRPASAARSESANALLQQHGGGPAAGNLSQPLVPKEAVAMAQQFDAARAANPLVDVKDYAQIDQRSAEYAQRADIQAWMKANPELAKKFMAKQRPAAPQTAEQMPEMTQSFGGEGATNQYNADLKVGGTGQPLAQWEQSSAPQEAINAAGPEAAERFGAFDRRQQAMSWSASPAVWNQPGFSPTVLGSQNLEVAYKPDPAQAANLNGPDSPFAEANAAQRWKADRDQMLMQNPLLAKYASMASVFNTPKVN